MKKLWANLGIALFWLSWPALWLYLNRGERARVLMVCDKEVLLVRSWFGDGSWSLPGGGIKFKEIAKSAALRELQEELGITIAPTRLTYLFSDIHRKYGFKFRYHCFITTIEPRFTVKPRGLELLDAQWHSKESLLHINCDPEVQRALDTAKAQDLLQ